MESKFRFQTSINTLFKNNIPGLLKNSNELSPENNRLYLDIKYYQFVFLNIFLYPSYIHLLFQLLDRDLQLNLKEYDNVIVYAVCNAENKKAKETIPD